MISEVQRGHSKVEPYLRLAEINRAITTSLDFDRVLTLIVENAAQLVEADISLLLLTDNSQVLRIRASLGVDQTLLNSFYGRMEEDVIRRLHRQLNLNSRTELITVPVIAQQSLNGLLVIAREEPLTAEEHWQLSALADQAAIALRNARLYEMELAEANRKRDETLDALQAANARVTRILESITDLYYQLDQEWRFVDVNRQTEIRFKKDRSELIGQIFWEVFPKSIHSILYPMFHDAVENMEAKHFEVESKIVAGAWFDVHAYPSTRGLSVYLRDITERKHSELTKELLSAIVESSDDAIISKSLDGTILSWNAAAEQIFGYTAAEAIGNSILMIIPNDRQNEEPAIIERIISGQLIEHYETVRKRKDGTLIDIAVTVSPLKDSEGRIVGASKIARDITDQRKAREEIVFQARLLNAVEQAVIATNLSGRVIFWNDFAESLYGWSAEEAIGNDILSLTPADNSKELANEIFETLQQGKSWAGEMNVRRRDGTTFPAMITDSPIINEKGVLIGVVGVSVDISDEKIAAEERQKLLEREKAARAEAETANRLKDEFLATLSHELRNPLNVVIGYSEILRRTEKPLNDEFVAQAAEVIRRNALAQSQLVSDLLDLSRLQMGKLTINREKVSLSTIVNDAIETVKTEAQGKDITVDFRSSNEALVVDGDPVRLGQITWNLLNNAVKFTGNGGRITISLEKVEDAARLGIEDTGQGIAPDFLPHVFEIFRQADGSSSRRQGGLGIGLALVKQLAELHGGRVEAASEGIGRGAYFSVWLPILANATKGKTSHTGNTGILKRKFILVVDDSRETTEMLSKLLQMEGAFVWTARSGMEALSVAKDKTFDLIISDISMPEMDGYQLLKQLRKLPSLEVVPALALTGFGRTEDVERAQKEGFARHFTKPLDIEKLLQTVRELTSS